MIQRIALITGANKGIGFETARQLAQAGLRVVVACRDPEAARQAAATLVADGLAAEPLTLDVADGASIAAAAATLAQRHGRLDVLVNNAAILRDAPDKAPSQQTLAAWRETFDTNLFGVVELTGALLPLLRKSDAGRIVNVSSLLGSIATHVDPESPFYHAKIPAYNVSKTALNAWTVHLAYELRDTPIKVNAANPGFVRTALHGMDAPLTPAEGARSSVQLATLADEGPTGAFLHEGAPLPW